MIHEPYKTGTLLVVLSAILVSITAIGFMTEDQFYVAAPAFAAIIIVLWLWMTLWARDRKVPFFDVGFICALATLIYTFYPLGNYWISGLQFGSTSDARLRKFNILPEDLGYFHLRHLVYLLSLVLIYAAFRGKGSIRLGQVRSPGRSAKRVIVLFFVLLTSYFFLLQAYTGLNYNSSYESDALSSRLSSFGSAPLPLLQISGKLGGILFVFKLALLFIVISKCRSKNWRYVLFGWIAAEILQAVIIGGARTGLILFLLAAALLYHRMIRPLTMKFLMLTGTLMLTGFMILGAARSYENYGDFQNDFANSTSTIFSKNNEFEGLLGTAYNIHVLKEEGTKFPWYLHINDFISILPPQQLLPFDKVPASEWYLREIGMSGSGQGYMWGVISQSIIGWDWVELVLRGTILGFILAKFHKWYLKRQSGFLQTLLYTYVCLISYYTFRDTTFSLLVYILWAFLPFCILLRIGMGPDTRKEHLGIEQQPSLTYENAA